MSKQSDLAILLEEYRSLKASGKKQTDSGKTEAWYLSAISCVKDGMSLADLDREYLNERSKKWGLPQVAAPQAEPTMDEKRAMAVVFRERILGALHDSSPRVDILSAIEHRDQTVGHGAPEYYQGNAGAFVPRTFFEGVKASLKWYDSVLDPGVTTQIVTESGNPIQVAFMSDVESAAQTVTTENSDQSSHELDIASVGEVDLAAWTYRTPLWRLSIEALQDLDQLVTAIELFQRFASDRIARGVGNDFINGNGSGKPLGLITSLITVGGAQACVATGSSESTGGAQTGANSIGYTDLCTLYEFVNQAYRVQPKCGWLMNDNTRSSIIKILDKYGSPIYQRGMQGAPDTILGKPIRICPSMPNIGAGNIPVIFGDLSYFYVRHATAGDRVQVVKETVGLIEKGEVGLRMWSRYDSALAYSSANGTPPLAFIVNHS